MSSSFQDALRAGQRFLFDGSTPTVLYERGVFINSSFEETNLTRPDLVLAIHREFVAAGAQVLTTNTWAANRAKLSAFGLVERGAEINREGARLARKALEGNNGWVAGCIGPLGLTLEPFGPLALAEAREIVQEQALALAEGGADLFVLESFRDLHEALEALASVKAVSNLPVAVLLSADEGCCSGGGFAVNPEWFVRKLSEAGADLVGISEGAGPATILEMLPRLKEVATAPILVQPSAGLPRVVDGRLLYMASPEYLGEFARQAFLAGARAIGGCAGTSPAHSRAMCGALRQEHAFQEGMETRTREAEAQGVPPVPFGERSTLSAKLARKAFVYSVELVPPRGLDMEKMLIKAQQCQDLGADCVNVPDGPRAMARLSALSTALLIQQRVGIETVLHYACRDRNLLGIQADLLGAAALGLHNVLAITGDPPKLGPYPKATAVFDVDAVGLAGILRDLNCGLDLGGSAIGMPASFSIGVGANPDAPDREREFARFERKVEAGAEWAVTQPVFDAESLFRFLELSDRLGIPVIAGLWPLKSLRNAQFMATEIPGVHVPKSVLERMGRWEKAEDQLQEGLAITREILEASRSSVAGIQLSAPFGQVELVAPFLPGTQGAQA